MHYGIWDRYNVEFVKLVYWFQAYHKEIINGQLTNIPLKTVSCRTNIFHDKCDIMQTLRVFFNSLAPGKFEWNLIHVIFKWLWVVDGWGTSCEIALIWMSLDFTDDQSTLVQVMAKWRQSTSHYLSPDLCCHLASLGHNELMSVKAPYVAKPENFCTEYTSCAEMSLSGFHHHEKHKVINHSTYTAVYESEIKRQDVQRTAAPSAGGHYRK